MKNIVLTVLLCIVFSESYSQEHPMKYSDAEWQEMIKDIGNKCESARLSINKKRRKRKIKKDLRIVKSLNEMVSKSYLNHSMTLNILKKNKVKLHSNSRSIGGDINYIWYSFTGGYIVCELYLVIRNDGSAYRINIDMVNLDDLVCAEMGHAPILNFHYVYKYLRPNMDFKLGFDGYEGSFMTKVLLDKSM